MDKLIHDLLYSIPDNADYAVDSTELDSNDIPQSRVDALKVLLNSEDSEVSFIAAIILTSWGYREGLSRLETIVVGNSETLIAHRLHSYDDSLLHALKAVKRYWSVQADLGNESGARNDVFPLVKVIIMRSSVEKFQISIIFPWLERQKYFEYIPLLKEHLELIIDKKDYHGWKICDVISFLMKFTPEYIQELLAKKGKSLDYYCS